MMMTASPDIFILDVGHGNCAVVRDGDTIAVLDVPPGPTLLEFLHEQDITEIEAVLVSHADADHIGGLTQLLSQPDIHVRRIFLNPDSTKQSMIWKDFRIAARDAQRRQALKVEPSLTTATNGSFNIPNVSLQVLAPSPFVALGGAGGEDLEDRPIDSNSLSAVIRLSVDGIHEVLIMGDLDDTGLQNLLDEVAEPTARVLVFPHHGGRPGSSDDAAFAKRLCQAVQPEIVIFSIGRNKYMNPRPGIIQGVRSGAPNAHIACTQLSNNCAQNLPDAPAQHLSEVAARGKHNNSCCAGSFRFSLGVANSLQEPSLDDHSAFISSNAPTALCRANFNDGGAT